MNKLGASRQVRKERINSRQTWTCGNTNSRHAGNMWKHNSSQTEDIWTNQKQADKNIMKQPQAARQEDQSAACTQDTQEAQTAGGHNQIWQIHSRSMGRIWNINSMQIWNIWNINSRQTGNKSKHQQHAQRNTYEHMNSCHRHTSCTNTTAGKHYIDYTFQGHTVIRHMHNNEEQTERTHTGDIWRSEQQADMKGMKKPTAGRHEKGQEQTSSMQTWNIWKHQQQADKTKVKTSKNARQKNLKTIHSRQAGHMWNNQQLQDRNKYKSMHRGKAIENQIADRQETNQSTSSMNKGNRGTD